MTQDELSLPVRPEDLGEIERLTLALIRQTAWRDEPAPWPDPGVVVPEQARSWKGYAFWALRRLSDAGLILERYGTRTVSLTPEGRAFAERALVDLGLTPRTMRTGAPGARRRVQAVGGAPAGVSGPCARAASLSSSALV
jgi:hypothetical protein